MDGFQKIDLGTPPTNDSNVVSKSPAQSPSGSDLGFREPSGSVKPFSDQRQTPRVDGGFARLRKLKNKKVLYGLIVAFVLFMILVVIPGFLTFLSAKKTYAQVKITLDAVKKQDIELADKELKKTRESLKDTQNKLNMLFVMRFIPGLHIYYNDTTHLVKAGFYGLNAADIFIESIKPYADVLGLKGQGSFVGGSAEQRIETAVKTMGKVTPRIDDIAVDLKLAQKEIDHVNPNDYPSFIAGGKVREGMTTLRSLADDGVTIIDEARPFIKVLPNLLGESSEKKYLIVFQNDKEIRPTGGFLTAYAVFRVDKGIIHVENSEDIYTLDDSIPNSKKEKAPKPIATYLPKVPQFNLRDTNLSPDFQKSMKTFGDLYKEAGRYKDVDGIIALDTHVLVSVMNILGDIQVGGKTYSTKVDERCNCPQVIYDLEESADRPIQDFRSTERKSIIGDLMYEIMNKAFSSSPKLYWGPLVQTGFSEIAQKHILFSLENKGAQAGLSAVNAAGEIKDFDGDYFHLNEANFGGAKSNLFVDQNVSQEYKIANDGTITKTVTVNYKNPHEPSDCNLERGGLCLNAPWRDWFRVYVPKGSKLVDSSGSEVKLTSYDDLGKTVFEGFLTVRPLGIGRLTLTYSLPFKLKKGSPLPFMIQKQPGTGEDEYTIKVNGKILEKFILETDKTLKLKI